MPSVQISAASLWLQQSSLQALFPFSLGGKPALQNSGQIQTMPHPTVKQIDRAKLAVQQAKARLQAIENRQSEAERKLDTRRKIIMGGLLIDAAAKDERYAKVVAALMARIDRDNDRKAFEGWTPPTAAPSPADTPSSAASSLT